MFISCNNNNPSFTARNKTIRYADDICRQANIAFPRISSTKIGGFQRSSDKFTRVLEKLCCKIDENRDKKSELFGYADTTIAEIIAILKPIKQNKVGNCGESSHIGTITAKTNGIKNCHPACLCKSNGDEFDHMVVFVYDDKHSYIIDPWLGFADYVENAVTKYKHDFYSIFKFAPDEAITFASKTDDAYTDTLKEELSKHQRNKLCKIFPKLKINIYSSNN